MSNTISDTITVAFEMRVHARKRVVGMQGAIPVHFSDKETITINAMIAKYAEPLQSEIESYIKLTRSSNGTVNNRTNRCRAKDKDI